MNANNEEELSVKDINAEDEEIKKEIIEEEIIEEEIIEEKVLYEISEKEKEALIELISKLNIYINSKTEMADLLYLNSYLKKNHESISGLGNFLEKLK